MGNSHAHFITTFLFRDFVTRRTRYLKYYICSEYYANRVYTTPSSPRRNTAVKECHLVLSGSLQKRLQIWCIRSIEENVPTRCGGGTSQASLQFKILFARRFPIEPVFPRSNRVTRWSCKPTSTRLAWPDAGWRRFPDRRRKEMVGLVCMFPFLRRGSGDKKETMWNQVLHDLFVLVTYVLVQTPTILIKSN